MNAQRESWLDALRGITICLVILHHSNQAAGALLRDAGRDLHFLIYNLNNLLALVRMPAFFLCSGILFAVPSQRGWSWFRRKRLAWTIWIAVLWGSLAVALVQADLHYMWEYPDGVSHWQMLLIEPVGNMWFIYAIAVLGAYCMAIRKLGIVASLALAFGLSVASLCIVKAVELPRGIEQTLWNLGVRGFIFFTAGFLFSRHLMAPRRGNFATFVLGLLVWLGCYYVMKNAPVAGKEFYRMVLGIPATIGAVVALQYLLVRMAAVSRVFEYFGRQSLELFLLHMFAISIAFAVLKPLARDLPSVGVLAVIFLCAMALSVLAAAVLRKVPGNIFFNTPAPLAARLERP